MKINRILWGMVAALAVIVSGCDDDDEGNLGVPSISVSESSLSFSQDGGAVNAQTITITSSRDWTASADEDWVTISPSSASASSSAVSVSIYVDENTGTDRTATVTFATSTVSATVSVTQSGPSGSVESTYVYYNDFDAEAATQEYGSGSSWPYLYQFDGWQNESGTGIDNVTYSYNNVSVRNNSNSNGSYSNYSGSGTNNLLFGATTNYFVVQGIALTSGGVDYTLTFGSERYVYLESDNTFNHDEFHVYISDDGSLWTELSYEFPEGDQSGIWDKASTTFTVPSGTSTLSIYFTADVASGYRLDDVILATSSESGTTIDFSTGVELGGDTSGGDSDYDEGTLGYILDQATGTSVTATGVVMGINNKGFVIADETANALVYNNNTNEKTAVDGLKIGDKVTVVGTIGSYGIPEIYITSNSDDVTIESSGNTVTYPEPTVITSDNIATYAGKWESCDYIQFTGILAISGYYYNVTIDGTSVLGSISSPTDDLNIANYTGVSATYTGYYAGGSNSNYLSMLAVSIDSGSSYLNLSTTSLTAPYAGGDVTFDISSDLDWTVTSSDETNFSVSPTSGTGNGTVTVTCTENTGNAREATITVSSSAGDKTVTITQPASPSGDAVYYEKVTAAPSDWAGKYLIVYDAGPYAFDGSLASLDAAGNYADVTITDYGIESTEATDAMQFSIWSDGSNGYYIKSASGYYIYATSTSSNTLLSSTTAVGGNTLSYDDSGIVITSTGGTTLQFNSTANNLRFRFYHSSQKAITLYKIPDSENEVGDDAGGDTGGDTYTLSGAGTAEDPYTVADALYLVNNSLTPSDKVFVKGVVTSVRSYSSSYNSLSYYIADSVSDESTLYVYSGYGLGEAPFSSTSDLSAGDEVVVYGALTLYGSVVEINYNNYLYSLNGVTDYLTVSPSEISVTADAGSTIFKVSSNVGYTVSSSDETNFTVYDSDGTVTVSYTANTGVERTATITVSPTASTDVSEQTVTIIQATAHTLTGAGTAEDPYTVADALFLCETTTYTSDYVYIEGIISTVSSYSSGTINYNISDDGSTDSELTVYKGLDLGGTSFSAITDIETGVAVVVYGPLKYYNDTTPEVNSGNYLISYGGVTDYTKVSSTDLLVSNEANSTATFDIYSNESWTVSVTGTDFTLSATSGTGDATITVTAVAENSTEEDITAVITVKASSGTQSVTITQSHPLPTFDSNVEWTLVASASSDSATINGTEGVSVLKIGTGSKQGSATFTVPSGTTSISLYAVAWYNGTNTTLSMTVGETEYQQALTANSGATGSSSYTITATASDYYTITLDAALTAETTVTVTDASSNSSNRRIIMWGINYSTK